MEVAAFVIRDFVAVGTVTVAAAGVAVEAGAVVAVVESDEPWGDGRAASDMSII